MAKDYLKIQHLKSEEEELTAQVELIDCGALTAKDLKERTLINYKMGVIRKKVRNLQSGDPEYGMSSGEKSITNASLSRHGRLAIH